MIAQSSVVGVNDSRRIYVTLGHWCLGVSDSRSLMPRLVTPEHFCLGTN